MIVVCAERDVLPAKFWIGAANYSNHVATGDSVQFLKRDLSLYRAASRSGFQCAWRGASEQRGGECIGCVEECRRGSSRNLSPVGGENTSRAHEVGSIG